MSSMMNIGVSGLNAQADRLATISNNIANSDTTAYKSQDVLFTESYIVHGGATASGNQIQSGSGTEVSSTTTNWTTGAVNTTNDNCDIMISGKGFLPVSLNNTTYYTRDGNFSLVETTVGGSNVYALQRDDGSFLEGGTTVDPTSNTIPLTGITYFSSAPTSISISANGTVTAEPTTVTVNNGRLAVQTFNNPDTLKQSENGLYSVTSSTSFGTLNPSVPGGNGSGSLTQGALEASNVDMATELTKLITSQRSYQANSKVITTADNLMETVMGMIR